MKGIPVIVKIADVEDNIGFYDKRLEAMRAAAEKEDFLSGAPNPKYAPLNMAEYRKIMLENIDKHLERDKQSTTESYNEALGRHQRGERESRRGIVGQAAVAGGVTGLVGGASGAVAGGIVGSLLNVIPRFRGKSPGTIGAMVGGGLGAAGLGSLGFFGMKPFRKREFYKHPGDLADYMKRYQDDEAIAIRKAYSHPYTGKGKDADLVRTWAGIAPYGEIKEDSVIKESSFGKCAEQVSHKYAAAKNDEDTAPLALLGNKITSPALTSYPKGETPPPTIGMGGANFTYDWSRTTPKQLVLPKGRKIVGALALAAGAGLTGLGWAVKDQTGGPLLTGIGIGLYGASRFIPSAEGRAAKRLLKNNESFSNSDTHDLYRGKFKSLGM